MTKKVHLLDRLVKHKKKIEDYFKIYYDVLDQFRLEYLNREYTLSDQINEIEDQIKKLMLNMRKMTMTDLFQKRIKIDDDMNRMNHRLAGFGTYLPEVNLKFKDTFNLEEYKQFLKNDTQQKLLQHI